MSRKFVNAPQDGYHRKLFGAVSSYQRDFQEVSACTGELLSVAELW